VEYRDEFTECSDCGVALIPGVAPGLVTVFESDDVFAIGLAKGSLEDAGIPFWMQGDQTAAHLVLSPIMFPLCRFLVSRDREAEARELLEPLGRS